MTEERSDEGIDLSDGLGAVPYKEHHIWCNFWGTPLKTCRQCKRLYALYPMDGMTGDELQKKYFPNAIKREGT